MTVIDPTKSHDSINSADNVLVLLMSLRNRGRLRVADAAEILSVSPSTAHRLLATLRRHELAEQDRQRAYLPSSRLAETFRDRMPRHDLGVRAHAHLLEISRATDETTHLVVLQGNGSRFIDGVDSSRGLRVGSRVGLLLPAHTTSGGKVLLAQLRDPDLLALYPDRQLHMRDGSARDLSHLRRELTTVRRQGYALNLEGSEHGVNAVGVPILTAAGRALGAIVMACPASRSSRSTLLTVVPRLRASAEAIAHNLA